jgi:hypothetical protein
VLHLEIFILSVNLALSAFTFTIFTLSNVHCIFGLFNRFPVTACCSILTLVHGFSTSVLADMSSLAFV